MNGARLAVDEVNRRGGVHGRRLALLPYPIGSYFLDARHAAGLAARAGVLAIVGANSSELSMAIAAEAEAQGVVQVSNVSTAQDLTWDPVTGRDRPFVFRVCSSDVVMGAQLASFARERLGARRAALLYEVGRTYSTKLARSFLDSFHDPGGERVAAEFFYLAARDRLPQPSSARIREFGPDVVFMPGSFTDATLVALQAERPRARGNAARRRRLVEPAALQARRPLRPAYFADLCPPLPAFERALPERVRRRGPGLPGRAGPRRGGAPWRPRSSRWGPSRTRASASVSPRRGAACGTRSPAPTSAARPAASGSTTHGDSRRGVVDPRGGSAAGGSLRRATVHPPRGELSWRPLVRRPARPQPQGQGHADPHRRLPRDRGGLPVLPPSLPARAAGEAPGEGQAALATLRDNYERDFIYDLLSENAESLAIHLADLAGQEGLALGAHRSARTSTSGRPPTARILRRLLGEDGRALRGRGHARAARAQGRAGGPRGGGRAPAPGARRRSCDEPLPAWSRAVPADRLPARPLSATASPFSISRPTLQAAGEPFGRLHVLYSPRPPPAERGAHPHAVLRPRGGHVRPAAALPEPAALPDRAHARAPRPRSHVAGGQGRPGGPAPGSFPRRDRQHCRLLQPHGGGARRPPSARSRTTAATSRRVVADARAAVEAASGQTAWPR